MQILQAEATCHRLVAARRRLDMGQAALARQLAVDPSTVSRLERGDMQGPPWGLALRASTWGWKRDACRS